MAINLASLAGQGALYAFHIRGERETILEAVAEAIQPGGEAGLAVQIPHNAPKCGAPCNATADLKLLEEARAQGQDVTGSSAPAPCRAGYCGARRAARCRRYAAGRSS